MQKERDEVINAEPENIRALADLIEAVLSDHNLCVIGNEDAVKKEKALFDTIEKLY